MHPRTKILILSLPALLLLFTPGFTAAAENDTTPSEPKTSQTEATFDLSFPGGTLVQFVEQIEAVSSANLVYPPGAESLKIPKMELRTVNVRTVMNVVTSLLEDSERRWTPLTPQTWVLATRPQNRRVQPFHVGALLTKYKVQDVTTAIETVWQMGGKSGKPELKYHQDTQLLIVLGDSSKIDEASQVLEQLRLGLNLRFPEAEKKAPTKP